MISVESILTRELDVLFIDARGLAAEARLSLGMDGYPSKNEIYLLRDEAVRIFRAKSQDEQTAYRRRNWDLEAVKIPAGSMSMSDYMDSGEGGRCPPIPPTSDSDSVGSFRSGSTGSRGYRGILRKYS